MEFFVEWVEAPGVIGRSGVNLYGGWQEAGIMVEKTYVCEVHYISWCIGITYSLNGTTVGGGRDYR